MWHVDEGALHAYLDGALDEYPAAEAREVREHLETCAECSRRLAEERRVREEAQEILGLAAPHVEVPTFEELRAYVRAQAPGRTAVSVRLYRLGWAASVMLALGTGWLLRGGVPPTTVTSVGRSFDADAGRSEEQPSVGAAGEAAPAERERVLDAAPPVGQEAQAGTRPETTSAAQPEPRREATRASAVPTPSTPQSAAASGFADAVDRDAAVAKADDDVALRTAPEPAALLTQAPAAARGGGAAADVAAEPPSATAGVAAARQDSAARSAQARRSASPTDERLTSAIAAPVAASPSPVAGAGAAANSSALGRTAAADAPVTPVEEAESVSLVVPGLEVLEVLRVAQGTTFAGTHALQRLPSGDTLEIIHLPEGVEPTSLPPLREGWSELVQPRGTGWLVMRAPLPPPSLVELLQRLESGR